MSWRSALILFVLAPLILASLACWLRVKRRNPVIRAKPQPDSRRDVYNNFMRDVK